MKALEKLAFERLKEKYPTIPEYAIPKKVYTEKTANGLTKAVCDCIELHGYQAERINSTGQQINVNGKSRWIKGSSTNGTADISSTIAGRSVKLEIKCRYTGDHYQSKDQKNYQKSVEKAGGVYLVVRDFDSFYSWFKTFVE